MLQFSRQRFCTSRLDQAVVKNMGSQESVRTICLGIFELEFVWPLLGVEERAKRAVSYVGIPVPGQTVNGLDILTLYTRACQARSNANDILSNAVNVGIGGNGSWSYSDR